MERIEIFTSKKKNIFLLFLVIIFLAVGIFISVYQRNVKI